MIPDLIRFITFLASAATVGLAILTVLTYAKVYREHRRLAARGEAEQWRGLLPLHVVVVGTSFLIFVIASVVATAERVNGDLTWRGPTYLVANLLGSYAMWAILSSSKHRKHDLDVHVPGAR